MGVKSKPHIIEWSNDSVEVKTINQKLKEQLFRINAMFNTLFTEANSSIETLAAADTTLAATPASAVELPDTDASHTLAVVCGSDLTADRTLTLTPGDADRTLTITGNASIAGTQSGTNTGDQTTITGNAGSATVLQTARTINGTSFNGSANITVTAAADTLTGTILASGVVTSSLTALGAAVDLRTTGNNVGFKTGAGGTAGQAGTKSTSVTLDDICGRITTTNDALAAGAIVTFTFNNSTIASSDVLAVCHGNGSGNSSTSGAYDIIARVTGTGAATITIQNISAGSLSESIDINFVVIKAVTS